MIASLIKEMVGVEFAPISFHYNKDSWGVAVGGGKIGVEVQTQATKDSSDNVTQIHNAPVVETGTGPITSGKAQNSSIRAFGWTWELTGKSSKHEPVDWKGP